MNDNGLYIILTAVSPNMWNDYILFYDSIRAKSAINLVVVSLELEEEHYSYIENQENVSYIMMDELRLNSFKEIGPNWKQWYKPFFIDKCINKYCPTYLLWIDVDAVVLKSLDELFLAIDTDFLVISDYFAPETTINDTELYNKYKCNYSDKDATLNSGVIGFKIPRDNAILELWKTKIKIISKDDTTKQLIKLYDQGALLWTMHEMEKTNIIKQKKEWNYPATRNPYEYITRSKNHNIANYVWPKGESQIGGDILNNIKLDNHDAVIAHFAGLPKLSHLCEVNNKYSRTYVKNKNKRKLTNEKIFCVGLERAGTHLIAEILRRSCVVENWIRHEHRPCLAEEAFLKFQGQDYKTDAFLQRMESYNREDCLLICESNHRLGFFIDDINEATENKAKFIVMLRNPVKLLASRLLNFTMWPNYVIKFPGFYQFDYFELQHTFGDGSPQQNAFRIRYPEYLSTEIIHLHLWEITTTIDIILQQLRSLSSDRYQIIWLDNTDTITAQIMLLLNNNYVNQQRLKNFSRIKFGEHLTPRKETYDWVYSYVKEHYLTIFDVVGRTLHKYGIPPNYDTLI